MLPGWIKKENYENSVVYGKKLEKIEDNNIDKGLIMNSNFDKRFYDSHQKTVNKHYFKKHQELRHRQTSIKKSMTKEIP